MSKTPGAVQTHFGENVAAAARAAFAHLEQRLAAIETPTTDQIRFAGDADFIQLWLAPRLRRFESAHPDLRVSLTAAIGMNYPPKEAFDCAVIWGRRFWRDFSYEPLMGNTTFPVAAPDFFDHLGRSPEIEDADEKDLIHVQSRLYWESFRPRAVVALTRLTKVACTTKQRFAWRRRRAAKE